MRRPGRAIPGRQAAGKARPKPNPLRPRQLRPRLIVKGSGIDWLSVSAEWEQEGMKLTAADLQRLQTATGRFVKLPDAGWVELLGLPAGVIILFLGGFMMFLGFMIIRRIVDIEVWSTDPVTKTDIACKNGTIHVIDTVLMPRE